MKLQGTLNPSRTRLWLETTFWRFGLLPFLALAFVAIAAIAWLWWVPQRSATISAQQQRLATLQAESRNGRSSRAAQPLEPLILFEQTLSDPAKTNDVIRHIFELARDSGVTISQADYRRMTERQGTQATRIALTQFQIALPVKGEYSALKHFSLSLLAELPAVSVDQMTFKREQPNSNRVDGQLLLSLWEHGNPGSVRTSTAQGGAP